MAMEYIQLATTTRITGVTSPRIRKWIKAGDIIAERRSGRWMLEIESLLRHMSKLRLPLPDEIVARVRKQILIAHGQAALFADLVGRVLEARTNRLLLFPALSVEECLFMLGRRTWNLLILDLDLPRLSPLETIAFVRKHRITCGLRVAAVSLRPEWLRAAIGVGADTALLSPVEANDILISLRPLLGIQKEEEGQR